MSDQYNVKHFFNRAHRTYDNHCDLQVYVGENLIHEIKSEGKCINNILDLGCGTGLVTASLSSQFQYKEFCVLDFASEFLVRAKQRLDKNIKIYEADFDSLPNFPYKFDLIFSNMALHWSKQFEITLRNIATLLNVNGRFAFSIPLAGSLIELESNYAKNNFLNLVYLEELFKSLNYKLHYVNVETKRLQFANSIDLFKSIKKVGANFVSERKSKGLAGRNSITAKQLNELTYIIGYFILTYEH